MRKIFKIILLCLAVLSLGACAQLNQQLAKQQAARAASPHTPAAKQGSGCKPNNGLAQGINGNSGTNLCGDRNYRDGNALGLKMYKLKERRRRAAEKIGNDEYNLRRKEQDLRRLTRGSERYIILNGEVAIETHNIEKKKFAVRRIDADIQHLQSKINNFRARNG